MNEYRKFLYDHSGELAEMVDYYDECREDLEKSLNLKWDDLNERDREDYAFEYFAYWYAEGIDGDAKSAYDDLIEYRKFRGWQ